MGFRFLIETMNKTINFIFIFLTFSVLGFSDEIKGPIAVENSLRYPVLIADCQNSKMNIFDRMEYYNTPGVSIAVIDNGKLAWAKGYGKIGNANGAVEINEHTLFQAASISKSLTAFGAMLLVQQGKIHLDDDVNIYLRSWQVPENEYTSIEKVTLRRLLSHSAGTNVPGFPGYSIDTPLPSTKEILDGNSPLVITDPVRVILKPGSELRYSGGGTTIVQLLIEDITGECFDVWMQENVLKPLGMIESTFSQPLPWKYSTFVAYGHLQSGEKVEGNCHVYPEMAAAGLWTTPSDLAKFILYIQSALKEKKAIPLNFESVKAMTTKQNSLDKSESGLGLFIKHDTNGGLVFSHNGRNEGFLAKLYGVAIPEQGVVIMVNNDSAVGLIEEITNGLSDVYGWSDFKPIIKKKIIVDPAIFSGFCGGYFTDENSEIEISVLEDKLLADFKNGFGSIELHPESEYVYFMQQGEDIIKFVKSSSDLINDLFMISKSNEITKYLRK